MLNRGKDTLVIESKNRQRKGDRGRGGGGAGFKHGGNVYRGGNRLGDTLEILKDSVRVSHVSWHGENSCTNRMRRKERRGGCHCQYLGRFFKYV